jgi:NTP pyrophosphatase (non-canonical NTP hydrolase)
MQLRQISAINRARTKRWHEHGAAWTSSDWSNALAGETGELCNIIKKIRRHETGVTQSYNTPEMSVLIAKLRDEIADVFLYLDLVANHFELDLEDCIFPKFNWVSGIQGFPERLPE